MKGTAGNTERQIQGNRKNEITGSESRRPPQGPSGGNPTRFRAVSLTLVKTCLQSDILVDPGYTQCFGGKLNFLERTV